MSPTSTTARTSASCRPGVTPTSSAGCGRTRSSPATSSISTGASSAAIRASCISPSASGADWASPPRRRFTWCGSMRPAAASWSVRARHCGWIASRCATSTGSATARSSVRSATAWRSLCECDRPVHRSRRGCARLTVATKSNSSPAKKAFLPARLACSTTRRQARPACSAVDSSRARPPGARWPGTWCEVGPSLEAMRG